MFFFFFKFTIASIVFFKFLFNNHEFFDIFNKTKKTDKSGNKSSPVEEKN